MAERSKQVEFYVSQNDQSLGPWTLAEIATRTTRGELNETCLIFVEARDEWSPLMQCEELREFMQSKGALSKPKSPPKPPSTAKVSDILPAKSEVKAMIREAELEVKAVSERPETGVLAAAFGSSKDSLATGIEGVAEWFVQKGANRYGPFSYTGLVRALQEKSIFEFDMVWKNGMDNWIRIAEHPDFGPEQIRDLLAKTSGETGIFFRRQHPRTPMKNEVIVHDNRSVWMGRSFEGSAGGSGVVIENATLVPGQVVLVHFASGDGLPAFNALCEVVSKKFQGDVSDTTAPLSYGVKFIKIDVQAEAKVLDFFRKKTKDSVDSSQSTGQKSRTSRAA